MQQITLNSPQPSNIEWIDVASSVTVRGWEPGDIPNCNETFRNDQIQACPASLISRTDYDPPDYFKQYQPGLCYPSTSLINNCTNNVDCTCLNVFAEGENNF